MKRKRLIYLLVCTIIAGGSTSMLSSCSSMRGHWGIEGEYPGYGTVPPPDHHHYYYGKPDKPKKHKDKKHKKHKKCRHHHD